ncbi:arginine--tRNA ligase [Ghiorsea bivora]|uniref:arginine--tRNA ligase n=1 Tax=Ghiorsea bivora TaxID=1485545 RepID=UPI0005705476|nr:arginine--tRNA ligase [Ghiorsea bivora]
MQPSLKEQICQALQQAVDSLMAGIDTNKAPTVVLTRPKQKEHGDYAVNIAMPLAGLLKQNPRQVAETILAKVQFPDAVEGADIAGPGFINIKLKAGGETDILKDILSQGLTYGCIDNQNGEAVNLEFVSANPTGPMHVGHGRGAVVGDSLANLLNARGYKVHKEYYINDAGNQIGVLANSVWLRMQELQGLNITFPDSAYPGDYIIDIAKEILGKQDYTHFENMDEDTRLKNIGALSVDANMAMIRQDLKEIGIEFDQYFSEKTLHESGKVNQLIEKLEADDLIYTGTLPPPKGKEVENYNPVEQRLFRTTDFGDDVDRPLQKQDGTATYFAADIAYHTDKFERGFKHMIDIWGADHGGYITRVQAAMKALTGLEKQPEVLLVQMVNLTRDGVPFKMSKRAGTFVTLSEVVEEVGKDAVRFNFMTRRIESQFDFDLEAAKAKDAENPVYYVQYAHARIHAVLRKAKEEGVNIADAKDVDSSLLVSDEAKKLIQMLLSYPEMLDTAASRREPYRIATFIMQLAAAFHSFYHHNRVLGVEEELMQARLLLLQATAQVIKNALGLLGVDAPESM